MKLVLVAGSSADSAEFAEMLRLELIYYYRDIFLNKGSDSSVLYLIDLDGDGSAADEYTKRSYRGGAVFYSRDKEKTADLELNDRQAVFVRPFSVAEFVEAVGHITDILSAAEKETLFNEDTVENIGASKKTKLVKSNNTYNTFSGSDIKSEHKAREAGDDLVFGNDGCTVYFRGETVDLTKREYELLYYLFMHRGRAVSRSEAVNEVWRYDFTGNTNIVEVYIRYLRKKLDERFDIKLIRTVRRYGYIIK